VTRSLVSKTAVALAVAAPVLACAPARAPRLPASFVEGDTAPVTTIPFELFDGRINVRAAVNGDSGWLILDSGSDRTGLDRAWALGIGVQLPWVTDTNRGFVHAIGLKTLTLRNYAVDLFSMRAASEAAGRFQAGILGADFLRRFTVEIDYGARVVRLYDRVTYRYAGTGAILPFATQYEYPEVGVSLLRPGGDSLQAHLLLDTGSGHLCLILMTPFAEKYDLATAIAPVIEGPLITGIDGPLRVAVGSMPALRLGDTTLDSVPTGLGRERRSFLAGTYIDGVLGSTLFHDRRLILDYARRRAIIEPGAPLGRDCGYDKSGLTLTAHGAGYREYRVDYVSDHSAGAAAGVQTGDWLLSIDGRPTGQLELSDVRAALSTEGSVRQLRLAREADTVLVALHLHRLF
jgi:hypothetical protein